MSHEFDERDEKILIFRTPIVRSRSGSDRAEDERGTVLLFTGVRYERPSPEGFAEVFVPPAERLEPIGDHRLGA